MKKLLLILAVLFTVASLGYCSGSAYSGSISSNSITLASGTTIYAGGAYAEGVYIVNTCTTTDVVLTFVDGGANGTQRFNVLCKAGLDRYIPFREGFNGINFNSNIFVYANSALANSLTTISLFYTRK